MFLKVTRYSTAVLVLAFLLGLLTLNYSAIAAVIIGAVLAWPCRPAGAHHYRQLEKNLAAGYRHPEHPGLFLVRNFFASAVLVAGTPSPAHQ